MTVPKSKVLSVSKGIMALADVKTGCPANSQTVTVNITPSNAEGAASTTSTTFTNASTTSRSIKQTKTAHLDASLQPRKAVIDGVEDPDITIVPSSKDIKVKYDVQANLVGSAQLEEENPYVNLPTQTRDLATLQDTLQDTQELQALLQSKDDMAKALTIMLNLIEHNPLIVNKYIVAPEETLCELIRLLTSGTKVTITYLLDDDVGCTCGALKYMLVDKIYVEKDGDTHVLKYSFPDATKLLDDHKISTKMIVAQA